MINKKLLEAIIETYKVSRSTASIMISILDLIADISQNQYWAGRNFDWSDKDSE